MNNGIEKLISFYGSQVKTAKALGTTQATISRWLKGYVSAERAIEIEKITEGYVSRQELCPYFFE